MAKAFAAAVGLEAGLYTDPSRDTYARAGLLRGVQATLSPRSVFSAFRAIGGGHMQGLVRGDPWQLGGVFVFGPVEEVFFAHVSQAAGDHPTSDVILEAVEAVAASRSNS